MRRMKRIIGIVLLVLAVIATVNVAMKFSHQTPTSRFGSRSYNAGTKVGMVAAPIILGTVGLWLLLASGKRREASLEQTETAPSSVAKPVILVIGSISILAVVVIIGLALIGANRKSKRNLAAPIPAQNAPVDFPPPSGATNSGTYSVDQRVVAHWGGKWIPGKITTINSGGFTMKVQLEDPRFLHPILLSTNQIRPE